MRPQDVETGLCYLAQSHGRLVPLLVVELLTRDGRPLWLCRNLQTGNLVRVRSAKVFRRRRWPQPTP